MSFHHHRKLMPYPSNLTQPCSTICDRLNNTAAAAVCSLICPPQTYPSRIPFAPLESPPPSSYLPNTRSKLSPTLKISIDFLVATFSIFVLYTLYKFYTVWSRSRMQNHPGRDDREIHDDFFDEDHGPVLLDHPIWYIRTIGLQQSVINEITIVQYKRGEGLVDCTDCSICLSVFDEDEMLRLLPKCSHAFHLPCIDTWLLSHTNCPLCRAGIVTNVTSPELVVVEDYSGSLEETQLGISGSSAESETEREDNNRGSEFWDEDELSKLEMGNGDVRMRRSVTLDCLSALRLSAEIAKTDIFQSDGNLGSKVEELNSTNVVHGRIESGCSIARSLQRGPDFIERSLSCSGKVFSSWQSR